MGDSITINGISFSKRPDCSYKNDYVAISRLPYAPEAWEKAFPGVQNLTREMVERTLLRHLILNDLWFVVYFVLGIPTANHPFVVNMCKEVENGPKTKTLDVWSRGHYKALDLNVPVLTTNGWKKHGDLLPGDWVYGNNGKPVQIIANTDVFNDSDCYKITFNNGYSIIASGDHLWEIEHSCKKRIKGISKRIQRYTTVLKTKDMANMPLKDSWESGRPKMAIKTNLPLESDGVELPIDPYVFGYWLGNGTSSGSNISCHSKDSDDIMTHFDAAGYSTEKHIKNGSNGTKIIIDRKIGTKICGRGHNKTGFTQCPECRILQYRHSYYGEDMPPRKATLSSQLKSIGVKGNKHIPDIYFNGSIQQRLALLQGLMDSDGSIHKTSSTAYFSNKNEGIAKGVFNLATSLGMKATIHEFESFATNTASKCVGKYFMVTFQVYIEMPIFRLKRKLKLCKSNTIPGKWKYHYIKNIEPVNSIPTSCIQVDTADGIYLVGPHLIPTHNSSIITKAETVQYHLNYPERSTLIFSYKKPAAERFVSSIKQTYESEFLKWLFPDCLYGNPDRESPSWSVQNGITIKRKNLSRSEATVMASGLIEGMATGLHCERRVYDDFETADIAGSMDVMNDCFEKFELSSFLGTKTDNDIERIIGTYYHWEGPLARVGRIKDSIGNSMYHSRIVPGTENGEPNGKPIFWTQEILDLEKTKSGYFSQILCNPVPQTERTLNPDYLQPISPYKIPRDVYRFMVLDPAGSQGGGDSWAMHLIGVQPKRDDLGASNIYIMDSVVEPMKQSEAIEAIIRMYINGGVIVKLGVEKVGQSTAEIHVAQALSARGRRVSIDNGTLEILKPGGRKKVDRIASALEFPLNNGKIFISTSILEKYRNALRTEMESFPYGKDDALDALSYVYDMIKAYRFPHNQEAVIYKQPPMVIPSGSPGY